jgi:hypothetical protein
MKTTNETIKLNDLYASAYLLANSIPLADVLRQENSKRATFVFPITKESLKLLNCFSSMKAIVEPIAYISAVRRLKQLVHLNNR